MELPNELQENIFSYLNVSDFPALFRSNKSFRNNEVAKQAMFRFLTEDELLNLLYKGTPLSEEKIDQILSSPNFAKFSEETKYRFFLQPDVASYLGIEAIVASEQARQAIENPVGAFDSDLFTNLFEAWNKISKEQVGPWYTKFVNGEEITKNDLPTSVARKELWQIVTSALEQEQGYYLKQILLQAKADDFEDVILDDFLLAELLRANLNDDPNLSLYLYFVASLFSGNKIDNPSIFNNFLNVFRVVGKKYPRFMQILENIAERQVEEVFNFEDIYQNDPEVQKFFLNLFQKEIQENLRRQILGSFA